MLGGTFGESMILVDVGKPVNGDDVLAEKDRVIDLDVTEGHFGDTADAGHIIQFGQIDNVDLSVSQPPSGSAFEVNDKGTGGYEVRLAAAMTVDIETLTLTVTATCVSNSERICVSPTTITVEVTFNRIANVNQTAKSWVFDLDMNQLVGLNLPSEYNLTSGNATGRTFKVAAGSYPLPTTGEIPSTEESCTALGGRTVTESGAEICLDYTFSNSKARTNEGGGCVLSGSAAGTECAVAFAAVRTCNLADKKPALDNSNCVAQACLGGEHAVGGKCPAFSSFVVDAVSDELEHNLAANIADRDDREPVALGVGEHRLTVEMTHANLLGTYTLEAVVNVTKGTLPPSFGLAGGTSDDVDVAAGYTGEIYRGGVTKDGRVIDLAAAPSGFSAVLEDDGRTFVIEVSDGIDSGSKSPVFMLTVNHSNRNRAGNYNNKDQALTLSVKALDNSVVELQEISNGYTDTQVYNFAVAYANGDYAGAKFTEVDNSPHFVVSESGVVGTTPATQSAPALALTAGTYAITVQATDESVPPSFYGTAILTLSLTVVADPGAGEYVTDLNPVVFVAAGHTGAVYTMTVNHTYTLTNYGVETANANLAGAFDSAGADGQGVVVFSIPGALDANEQALVVTMEAICPADETSSNGIADFCTAGAVAATLTLTLKVVPVNTPTPMTAEPVYGDTSFAHQVVLPWISEEGRPGGSSTPRGNYPLDQLNVVLAGVNPNEAVGKFVLEGDMVKFAAGNLPEPGAYTLTVHITHATDTNGLAGGFVGTVVLTISISVGVVPTDDPRGIKGVLAADRIGPVAGNPPEAAPIYVFVPHGEQDFDNGKTPAVPLFSLTVSDVDISVEIVGDLPQQPANSPYTLSVSADKRAILVFRTADPLKAAGSSETIPAIDISFTVRATGENASRYADNVQQFHMSAEQFVEPVVGPLPERGDTDANGALVDLSRINIASDGAESQGKTTYGDFTPTFSEMGAVAGFSVSPEGVVSVADLTAVGSHTYTVQAVSAGFRGVALFTVSVKVGKLGDVKFNNQRLIVGNGVELDDITHDTEGPDKDQLFKVNMVYHGERRGLHWIYGDKYYENENDFKNDVSRAGLSNDDSDWYSRNICETMGNGGGGSPTTWRLPTLIEMAGGVLPDGQTNFVAKVAGSDVASALGVFEIDGLTTNVPETVNLSVQAVNTGDEAALSSAANLGYFAGLFNASDDATKGYAAHVYYDSEVRVSDATAGLGRVVCVHATDEHEETAVWAELSVDNSANNAMLTMDSKTSNVTAGVKLGLGLFTARNQDEPQAVADPAADAFSVSRLDTHSGFVITPVAVIGGVSPEVSVPSDANSADIPETGTYTLSASFAPAGDYVGFAQRDFGKDLIGADEGQFDLVRLTVNWTKPPVFKGVVALASRTITATAINRISGGNVEGNMVYYGDVGGLHVMVSRNVMPSHPGVGPRLCEDGGGNWRNPTLSELGMLMSGMNVSALSLTVEIDKTNENISPSDGSNPEKRGAAEKLGIGAPGVDDMGAPTDAEAGQDETHNFSLTFPPTSDAQDGIAMAFDIREGNPDYAHYEAAFAAHEFRALSGLHGNDGEPLVFALNTGEQQASLKDDGSSSAAAVCVSEINAATYDTAGAHNQLAGVRIDDGSGKVLLTVEAIPANFSANAPAYTITARAFYFNDVLGPPNPRAVKIEDLTGLELSANITNNTAFSLTVDTVNTNGEIVIMFGDTDPGSNPEVEIAVKPPLGQPIILTVKFLSASGIGFAGTPVLVTADQVPLLNIAETTDPVASPRDRGGETKLSTLPRVDMAYGGQSRGLHWMFGNAYYTTPQQIANDTPDSGLQARQAWFSKPICDQGNTGGNNSANWRLPTLIEMAGGVLPISVTGTEITARVNSFGQSGQSGTRNLDTFEIIGAPKVNFLTLTVNGRNTDDAGPLPPEDHNTGYFVELFNAAQNETGGYRGYPAHVHYYSSNGVEEIRISQETEGKVVCVREVSNSYVKPPVWAEVSVDNRTGNSILTLSVAAAKATANVKMGLGLFTVRGRETPEAVADPAVSDFALARLDNHLAFIISPVTVSGGVSPEVTAPSDAASYPETGIYTLSVTFAPAGEKYVGFAQRDFGKTSYNETDESQFDVVRLTVDWTKPAESVTQTPVSADFHFAGTEIEYFEDVATVPGINDRTAGSAVNVDMKYYGDVGGLRVMYSQNAYGFNGESYGSRLCAAGNVSGESTGWRNPTISELGMLLTGPSVTVLTMTVSDSGYGAPRYRYNQLPLSGERGPAAGYAGMPGNAGDRTHVLEFTFPGTSDDGMIAELRPDYDASAFGEVDENELFRVKSGLYDNAGEPLGLVVKTASPSETSLDVYAPGLAVCVQEITGYDATKHNQLAGIRFEAEGDAHGVPADGDIALSVSAITVSGVSFSANAAVFTLTAKAFIFDDVEAGDKHPEVIIKDLTTNLSLSVGLTGANAASFALATSDGTDSGSDMIVISYGATDPGAKYTVEIEVKPPLGAKVILTVEFDTAVPVVPIAFAGTPVALSMSVRVLSITATEDPVSGSPGRGTKVDKLEGVEMVYHGESRGLHWMVGDKYYETEGERDGTERADGSLKANEAWFSVPICVTKGNSGDNSDNWRLPTLIELAGGVLPATETGTEIVARVNGVFESGNPALDAFDIVGLATKVNFLTLTVKAKTGDDDKGQLPESTNPNNGYFAGMFNAGPVDERQRGYPAHVHYDDTGNEVEISRGGGAGKVVCVREAESTPPYSKPPVWAEVSVDNRTGNSILTLSVTAAKVTANVKMGLGLFTVRGRETPEAVADPAVSDFSLARLDSHSAFIITPVTVSGGVSPEVTAPSDGASAPDTGIYTLSVTFAPAGEKYVGYAQRDFGKTSYNSTDESQFDVVRLTVDWTKPAVALDNSFDFGDTTIDAADGVAVVTVTNRTFTGSGSIEMKYYGDVGGLRVMYSTQDPLLNAGAGSAYGPHLCAAGGANWRNPTLTELAMLLTGPTATGLTLTVQNSGEIKAGEVKGGDGASAGLSNGMPGQTSAAAEALNLTFPTVTDAKDGMIAALRSDYTFSDQTFQVGSGLHDNNGQPMGLIFDASKPDQAGMDAYVGSVWVCVWETDEYPDPSPHNQLAGIRFEAAGDAHGVPADGDIALSVGAITVSGVSFSANAAVFTLTAKAFIFDDVNPVGVYDVVIKDLTTNLSLSVGLAGANASSFALTTSDGTDSGSDMIVISYGDADPGAKNVVEIEVKPPLGAKVILTVELDTSVPAPPLANNVVFGGVTISVVSMTVTVEATDNGAPSSNNQVTAEMEYYGDVGGLRVMFSRNLIDGPASLGPRLCEGEGGTGWRNPTLSELGMLLTGPSVTVLTLTVEDGGGGGFGGPSDYLDPGTPGNANIANKVVNMTFPAATDTKGGMVFGDGNAGNEFRVISGLFDNGAVPLIFVYNKTSAAGQAALKEFDADPAVAVCVKEIDSVYDAADHNQLAGVRRVGVSLSVSFMTLTVTENLTYGHQTPFFTITAQGYFFPDTNTDDHVVVETLMSAALSVDLGDSDDGGFYALSSEINGDGDTVIQIKGIDGVTAPSASNRKVLEIQVTPPLGAPMTFNVEFMNLN